MTATIIFVLLFALMLTGMPVSISLGLTVLAFLFAMTQVPIESVALKLFTGIERFEIMAIPFFILAGNFLTHGGVARRMINFATSMVGHWHGGLGLAGVMAWAMVKAGFPKRFGAGVITTSGALGILIPPSIVMVMYSVATNTSVGTLFMAGVVPGLILAFMLGAVTWYRARNRRAHCASGCDIWVTVQAPEIIHDPEDNFAISNRLFDSATGCGIGIKDCHTISGN